MRNLCTGLMILGCWAAGGLAGAEEPKPDPAATRLLADARAARATWQNFPGFTADIVVNFDGQAAKGQARVDPSGKVTMTGLDKDAEAWARRQLGSQVSHRFAFTADKPTPCALADTIADHPLGQLIKVLNDELHSSYRIRDNQILVVNRSMDDGSRFTINVLENRTNAEGKYLPVSYVVNSWESAAGGKEGKLTRSEGHFNSYQRVGGFDLPAVVRIVAAGAEEKDGQSTRSLTLSNHKLLEK